MSLGMPSRGHLSGAVLDRTGHHGVHQLLAVTGCLPDLSQVMPDVVGVEHAEDVAGPAAHQFGSMHHHVHHMAATPIVTDEVDRFVDVLELALEPVAVGNEGRREVVGQRRTESRRGQSHHIRAPEGLDQWVPDRVSLRIAMHQDNRHGSFVRRPDRR